ncbi:MAG: glycoside hydrolase family protein [Planctomycetota bacterium]|jgi:hypothetical protein
MKSPLSQILCIVALVIIGGPAAAVLGEKTQTPLVEAQRARLGADPDSDGQRVELGTRLWRFNPTQPAHSRVDAQTPRAEFAPPLERQCGFIVKMEVDLQPFDGERTILDMVNVLNVRLRQHDPVDRKRQNYPAFKMPDGSVPVLEATLMLHCPEHPDWKAMTIGIPLALLKHPQGRHELVLRFSGAQWQMYVDGEMLDNDFPFGYAPWAGKNTWKLDPQYVAEAELVFADISPEPRAVDSPRSAPGIQYWVPRGHNNWVGDVATIFHQGRYHVFYLYDRRHHQSKFGCGAHYFEHLSTTDFKIWTEHEAATPLQEQWECIGTGMPFVLDGKLCLSYGWHTTRVYARERTTLPAQWEHLNQHGNTGTFSRATTPGVPAGSTYSVSADGVAHFAKSHIMFHPCENPSVYTNPDGKLQMLANYGSKGIWEAKSIDGPWRCINPGFPPGGDCSIFFRWGEFDYIVGGFTGLWSKPAEAPNSAYEDLVRQGLDFYDGSNVPSITQMGHGRFLMAAWIPIRGWGGPLIIRELIQFADGRIGSKWMPEIVPQTEGSSTLTPKIADASTIPTGSPSFMLTFVVQAARAGRGRMGLVFLPENGEQTACEFQMRLDDLRAQFGPGSLSGFAGKEKSLSEGGAPHHARNFAIENLIGVDRPFTVRVIVKGDNKIGGSLIDAEIATQRTMISYRPDLTVTRIAFHSDGVELKDVRIAPLREPDL